MLRIPDPAEAVLLGLRITHELMRRPEPRWSASGSTTAPAVERDGDYFGAAVNLAARVSSVAAGGEVLLTGKTAALAPDLAGVLYEPRGRQELRNVREPVDLFAAVRQGEQTRTGCPSTRSAAWPSTRSTRQGGSSTTAPPTSSAA